MERRGNTVVDGGLLRRRVSMVKGLPRGLLYVVEILYLLKPPDPA